ncbi:MAG: hypothetical protein WD294_03785 [Phycisphaeraceae bacterium]
MTTARSPLQRLPRWARTACALGLLITLIGCETAPKADGPSENVRLGDLRTPPRHATLDNAFPDSETALNMAVPDRLQQPVLDGSLLGSTRVLTPGLDDDDADEETAAQQRAEQERQAAERAIAEQAEADREAAREAAEQARPPRRVTMRLMVFEHPDPRVARATDMLAGTLPEAEEQAWRENGFVVGELDRRRLPLFLANLPRSLSIDVSTLHRVNAYWPLTLIDHLRGPQYVNVADAAGDIEAHRLVGGKFQFLIKLVPSVDRDRKQIYLDLLPHHKGVRAELLPRSPRDRVLDGTSFDNLRFYHPLSTERVWIFAADLPLEPAEDEAEGDEADGAAEPEPIKLGHAMLQGQHRRQQVQIVLLVISD